MSYPETYTDVVRERLGVHAANPLAMLESEDARSRHVHNALEDIAARIHPELDVFIMSDETWPVLNQRLGTHCYTQEQARLFAGKVQP